MSSVKSLLAGSLVAFALIPVSAAFAHGCHDDIRRDEDGWHRHIAGCDRFGMPGYRPSGKWTYYELPWLQGDPRDCRRVCHRNRAGRRWCKESCN